MTRASFPAKDASPDRAEGDDPAFEAPSSVSFALSRSPPSASQKNTLFAPFVASSLVVVG